MYSWLVQFNCLCKFLYVECQIRKWLLFIILYFFFFNNMKRKIVLLQSNKSYYNKSKGLRLHVITTDLICISVLSVLVVLMLNPKQSNNHGKWGVSNILLIPIPLKKTGINSVLMDMKEIDWKLRNPIWWARDTLQSCHIDTSKFLFCHKENIWEK